MNDLEKQKEEDNLPQYTKEDLIEELEIDDLDGRQLTYLADYINNFFRSPEKQKTKKKMRLDAGYSKWGGKNIESRARPIVKKMFSERLRALKLMAKKADKASYRDLTLAVDKLTSNIELLTGGATERTSDTRLELTDGQYERLFKLEAKRRGWRPPEEGTLLEEPEGEPD